MWRGLLLALLVSGTGCTFYTSCPNGNAPPNPGAGGTGGTGSGGGAGIAQGGNLTGTWVSASSNLAGLASECGNMSYLAVKPQENLLIAGIAQDGLFSSGDGGGSWQPLGTGMGSAVITNRTSSLTFDPSDAATYWETGIYNGGGVYKTTDHGVTFSQLGTVMHDDFLSIDFTDANRQTMLVSGHEADHKLSLSTDGGMNWNPIGDKLPSGGACSYPIVIDSQTFLMGCRQWAGSGSSIYRSTDQGMTWNQVSDQGGASAPLFASDGTIYWGSDASASLVSSTDQGQTWTTLAPSGLLYSAVQPIELPDGRLATIGAAQVVISADKGLHWTAVTAAVPYNPTGVVYSPDQKAFYIWHFTCGMGADPVPADAILRYDFDYQAG